MTDLTALAAQLSPKARELLGRELARTGTPVAAESATAEPIALIGMGCRLPGDIVGPESYWDFLIRGADGISEVPSDRWDADEFYDPDPAAPGRMTTKWGGFISDVAGFDAEFFGISPREAQATDPQQRALLEVAWEALEHAGIPPDSLAGSRTAVMAGLSTMDYMLVSVEHRAEIDAYLSTGIPHSSAVGRISYLLGLRGPAVAVDTACSSSLVAVHLACQSLRLRESDLALAGGVQLNLSPYIGIALSKYSALSLVGRCKAFDAAADGFVQSEGCGMVVLKRLSDAQRDGDRVLSVLRGSAINQDGRSNGMTAPNAAAQREVIIEALRAADVAADTVGYVEAHGTGTPLGDPVEFEGLASTYGRGEGSCALGAVKTNLGHLEAAGGVAGLIKATMALRHGQIPANLHFTGWNPAIDASSTRFFVPTESTSWPTTTAPRRAAVSSFGFSGTNAHVVLEQAPPVDEQPPDREGTVATLLVSGKTRDRLALMAAVLADWIEGDGADVPLADVAHTLINHRTRYRHVAEVCARDRGEAVDGLRALAADRPAATVTGPRDTPSEAIDDFQVAALAAQPNRSITATDGRLADIPRTPWLHVTHWLTDRSAPPAGPQVLLLSASSREAVNTARGALAAELAGNEDVNMSDVAFTLAGRPKDTTRMAAVVHDRQHAVKVLQEAEHENIFIGEAAAVESPSERVVFAFPGQGAQHAGMARGLYDTEPVFAEHFDRCAASFLDELGVDLRTEVFDGAGPGLERTDRAQPALFTVEYALAKLIESYGVHAAALCGHSIGEFVAAALAGVFDLETAISAVSLRARLMHASPAGAMIAVPLGPAEIAEHLPPDVDVSAINDHGSCVVAGTKEGIRAFTNKLSGQGITVRRVRTAHGFHSRSMDDVVPEFEGFLSGLAFRKPDIPLLSNVTGSWLTDAEATDPGMWARQVRQTVRFADEVDAMLAHPSRVLVEVGPGGSLTASAVRHPRWSNGHRAVRLMRHPTQNRDDRDVFLLGLGQLWAADIDVDWTRLSSGSRPRVVSLSSYPSAHEENSVGPTRAGHLTRTEPPELDQSHIEAALQGIVAECLGLSSVDVNADFFDIGTDSLIAAGVALRAANEGLDVTPQDLYEHPTVARLAKAVAGRYLAGGLTHKPPTDEVNPPVPPNIAHFLERGLEEPGRWRVPMILRLDPRIGPDDVRSVLTALANTHDALRLQIVERAGTWEQQIAPPQEFAQLSVRPLAGEIVGDSGRERAAIIDILGEIMAEQGLANTPLAAVYVAGPHGDSRYLGITLHETACDNAAREILVADLFTAFAQRMAGQEIVLQPTTTTWREWSHRCAELAGHPAVIASRQYWLANSTSATLRLADDRADGRPHAGDMTRLSSALTTDQTAEVDDARRRTKRTMDATLLGALSRTIAHVIGEGVVAVDLEGAGRSVLKPDVDLRRTVGWFTTIYPVPLTCTTEAGATELLETINETLAAVPHYGIGYGLLRYMFAPTARHLAAARPPDIHFSYLGTIPVPPAGVGPIEFDSEVDMPVRETIPGLGHAVELRVYRVSGALRFDWWYDTRRVERATAEALAQHFPVALAELTRQASESTSMDHEADGAVTALSLVDLSATDTG